MQDISHERLMRYFEEVYEGKDWYFSLPSLVAGKKLLYPIYNQPNNGGQLRVHAILSSAPEGAQPHFGVKDSTGEPLPSGLQKALEDALIQLCLATGSQHNLSFNLVMELVEYEIVGDISPLDHPPPRHWARQVYRRLLRNVYRMEPSWVYP